MGCSTSLFQRFILYLEFYYFQLVNPSNTNEDAIAEAIKTRLNDVPGIPFIDIVKEAFKLKLFTVVRRVKEII